MASTSTKPVTINAIIGGQRRSRADVLAWEDKRITAAAKKLGVPIDSPSIHRRCSRPTR